MAFCSFVIVIQDVKNWGFVDLVTEECDADVKRRNVEKCLSLLVLRLQGVGSRGRLLIFFFLQMSLIQVD